MADVLSTSLVFPALFLALVGWLVPKLLSTVMPEGVKPLLVLSILSVLIMVVITSGLFVFLYLAQGATLSLFTQASFGDNMMFLLRLSVSAGIIWAPIMVLSIAGLPRTWTSVEW
ncbi:hypothetical protein FHS72_002262 [Loktanella ponticola]|uniref:Uncharacterized protein n=1 Tax=Yoonia ponticola TaxID=1524255 RepID=A0A7W9F071_9RHOB|nr:hypothetical protein [Yoonia ponticola]MBB5722636.1 hypothetical protein [Yoonia ponticola]